MSIFQNSVETRELHKKEALRTRYYRNSFDQIINAFTKIATEEDMQLQNVNKRYGDAYLIGDGFEVIIQMIQINPIETSVDFKVNYFQTFGWNKPEKKAVHLYSKLDELLNLKGTVLHP